MTKLEEIKARHIQADTHFTSADEHLDWEHRAWLIAEVDRLTKRESENKILGAMAGNQVEYYAKAFAAERAKVARLREALGWFLDDPRYRVAVGGNPIVVKSMLVSARMAHAETGETP